MGELQRCLLKNAYDVGFRERTIIELDDVLKVVEAMRQAFPNDDRITESYGDFALVELDGFIDDILKWKQEWLDDD
jgi:hypothetical protein